MIAGLLVVSLGSAFFVTAVLWGMGLPAHWFVPVFAASTLGFWIFFAQRMEKRGMRG